MRNDRLQLTDVKPNDAANECSSKEAPTSAILQVIKHSGIFSVQLSHDSVFFQQKPSTMSADESTSQQEEFRCRICNSGLNETGKNGTLKCIECVYQSMFCPL